MGISEAAGPLEDKLPERPEKKEKIIIGSLSSALEQQGKAATDSLRLDNHEPSQEEVERVNHTFGKPDLFPHFFRFHLCKSVLRHRSWYI